jgi:hypothetical protein
MRKLTGNQVCSMKQIRAYVARNPGRSKEEIYAATGLKYGLKQLLELRLVRWVPREDGRPGYIALPMGPVLDNPRERLPHPDLCLEDKPNHERVGL